jgi:hypothetical protein
MTVLPIVPDPVITPLFAGRYARLAYTLQDVTLSELLRIQTRESFTSLFSLQDQFIASICWDKVIQPVATAYYACQRQQVFLQKLYVDLDALQNAFAAQVRNATSQINEESLRNIRRQEIRIAEETCEFNQLCEALNAYVQQQQPQNPNIIVHVNPNNNTSK